MEAGTIINQYKIISPIGKGGMGEVFLAQDTKLNRNVALKILPSEFAEDKDRMSRFVREAQSASGLNHPNIITIYEIGEADGTHFIATEFIEGKTLQQHLKGDNVSLKSVLDIAIQIASALQTAHSAGIVHRDIKPDNVMIRADGLAKILDFGIAKLSEPPAVAGGLSEDDATAIKPNSTSPGMIIGTANHMSPEQAKGKEIDARSDIFSFGIVFYEMLTGERPFDGETALESISSILKDEPKPISQILPEVPGEIERIVNKTLRKDREARYQTAKDLVIDLKDAKQSLELQNLMERSIVPNQDENRTQILKATTSDEINQGTTNQAVLPNQSPVPTVASRKNSLIAGILGIILVTALGIGSYLMYGRGSGKQIESIAVLPFENRSGNSDTDYLSDGLAESLIYRLSQLPGLKVSPTNSVLRFKGSQTDVAAIAKELEADAVMTGRLTQRGDDLTISVELTDANTKKLIWAEQYSRKMSDLLATQREIAGTVVQKLQLRLSGDDTKSLTKNYTDDNEAYQLYLKGRFYWNKRTAEGLKLAIENFKAASDKDPNFALAYVGLADSYLVGLYNSRGKDKETLPLAKAFASRALEIDPSLAEAYASLGLVDTFMWSWADSEKYFKRALELNPNYPSARHWYSRLLRTEGRYGEGFEQIMLAKNADPLSLAISNNVGENLLEKGDVQGAVEESRRGLEIGQSWVPYRTLAYCYLRLEKKEEALTNARKSAEFLNGSAVSLKVLGYIQAQIGNRAEAQAIAREIEEKFTKGEADGRDVAVVYAGLGNTDKVFEWLEKDFENHSISLTELRHEVPFVALRDDPRFKDLMKRMKLPE